MNELPRHPQSEEDQLPQPRQGAGRASWRTYALVVAGVALVVVMVVLHLAGVVGPSSN